MESAKTITFGLTGGIACGKSTIAKTFQQHGIPLVDADMVARQVVELGTDGLHQIILAFGKDYLQGDGTLDRVKLGELVFSNSAAMSVLNKIMGPLIEAEGTKQIKKLHDDGNPIVGYDAALICEMGHADLYRPLIVAACSKRVQLGRLMSRNNLTAEQAMVRIEAQMPVERKARLADHIIYTEGSIEESVLQTERLVRLFKQSII